MNERVVVGQKVLEHLRRSWWKEMADDIARAIGESHHDVLQALADLIAVGKVSREASGYAIRAEPVKR